MTPFIVELDIVTPVQIREHMMLDGLLAYCKRTAGSTVEDALNNLPLEKRTKDGSDYWAASRFFYRHIPAKPGKQRKHTPFDELRQHTKRKGCVSAAKGVDKSYLNKLHLSHITKAIAFGVGDVDEVDCLLQQVSHFGGLGRVGYGKVISAQADDFDYDYSEAVDGMVVRPLPCLESDADAVAGTHPPYWDKSSWRASKLPACQNPKAITEILSGMDGAIL